MYREDEASRLGAVVEAALAKDSKAAIAAAAQLWLAPEEDQDATVDAWRVLGESGLLAAAVQAGVQLVRDGHRPRPGVFVDLAEYLEDVPTLTELATLAIEAGWDARYPAATFTRLLELDHATVTVLVANHRDKLHAKLDTWILVGVVLTTSPVGDRNDVDAWFEAWQERTGVPMWLVAAYIASLAQINTPFWDRCIALAHLALARCVADETKPFFDGCLLVELLDRQKLEPFLAGVEAMASALNAHLAAPLVDHPIVRYANTAKNRRRITEQDFEFSRGVGGGVGQIPFVGLAANAVHQTKRPPDWRVVELMQALYRKYTAVAHILPLFAAMLPLERGDPRAGELYAHMRLSSPRQIARLEPHWQRLVKQRVTWWQWFKIQFT